MIQTRVYIMSPPNVEPTTYTTDCQVEINPIRQVTCAAVTTKKSLKIQTRSSSIEISAAISLNLFRCSVAHSHFNFFQVADVLSHLLNIWLDKVSIFCDVYSES